VNRLRIVIVVHVGFRCIRCGNFRTVLVELAPVNPEDLRTFALDADEYRVCADCVPKTSAASVLTTAREHSRR
jgi:hypothetical protein